ncbi:expressed unknown protein [Seminavis robusta]|uniref:Uncharacterized protein n=1 Tax=Seminavis robusta TaxID=568900 RepID=A0A9N8H259_9STRA|nr:expressed unknown protein [Seminavis robusta]|eukprot:Sro30_g019540.1 n/a (377) ;mRNA; r:60887-62139
MTWIEEDSNNIITKLCTLWHEIQIKMRMYWYRLSLFSPAGPRRLKRGISQSIPYWKSQADEALAGCDDPSFLLRSTAKKTGPSALFPWRHESDLPDRLLARQRAHNHRILSYENSTFAISALTARLYLNVPLWRMLASGWGQDLADNCSWAFYQAVQDVIHGVYGGSANCNSDQDSALEFEYTHQSAADHNIHSNNIEDDSESQKLMEPNLYNLYSEAKKSGQNQIQVYLRTKPTRAQLHSLHALPALNRSMAKKHPLLLREIEQAQSNSSTVSTVNMKQMDRIVKETGTLQTTVFAEVLVWCDEVFRVTNLETGALLQGYDDGKEREVVHGVRLEIVSTVVPRKGKANWIITDIDDLLLGNTWYSPSGAPWYHSG